jgi:hypothetical protein
MKGEPMRRRAFIAGLGSTAAWPLAARAQQRAMPTIGWLHSSLDKEQDYIPAFYRGLAETGFVEGRNVAVEHRWLEGPERSPALAAELVHRQVAVIVVVTNRMSLDAKRATQTIPIVFLTGDDPVEIGLVPSFNRPAGNVTEQIKAFCRYFSKLKRDAGDQNHRVFGRRERSLCSTGVACSSASGVEEAAAIADMFWRPVMTHFRTRPVPKRELTGTRR